MTATPLSISALGRALACRGDEALSGLLRSRPDLVHPAPGDFTGLAVRVQSETSLRQVLMRLDAGTLSALAAVCRGGSDAEDVPDAVRDRLRGMGLLFSEDPESGEPTPTGRAGRPTDAVPGSLLALLAEPEVASAAAGSSPGAPAPRATEPAPPAALVRNAGLSATAEVLADVEQLLDALEDAPAATLRSGGVGMRELRRLTAARTGERPGEDHLVGETGWLLELTAAAALIGLDVDTGTWRTTETARRWRRTSRHRRHQLLVSGWLLAPRSPLLVLGPHPRARIAPALTQERTRGDAPALRRRLLQLAAELTADSPALLYRRAPEDESGEVEPTEAALAASVTGTLIDRFRWERPLAGPRIGHLLPAVLDEAERLGLTAMGALTEIGRTLMTGPDRSADDEEPHDADDSDDDAEADPEAPSPARMAAHLADALPPAAETVHVQSDLTVMPTGTPSPTLAAGLAALAEPETRGPVPTYRLTSASVHRALDAGWTPDQVRRFLTDHSIAALPSPLTTLLDDAARTWRGVQIGGAGSWIRESDPQIRAELLDSPALRRVRLRALTGEVLISPAGPRELALALHDAGFGTRDLDDVADPAPDPGPGRPDDADRLHPTAWSLTASPWQQSPVRTVSVAPATAAEVRRAVDRLRAGGPARSGDPAVSLGADVVGLLRTAVRERRRVRIRRVDAHGIEHTLSGVPSALNAGRLRLQDGEGETVLLVHRITGVRLAEDHVDYGDRGASPAPATPRRRS